MTKIESLLRRVGPAVDIESHSLLKKRDSGKILIVAISADKGLCGAFNSHVIENTESLYRKHADENGENPLLVTIGNKVFNHFNKRDYPIKRNFKGVISRLKYQHAEDLSKYLQEIFLDTEEDIKQIEFIYTQYISASKQEITVKQLFPIAGEWEKPAEGDNNNEKDIEYIFEPSREAIFEYLLPKYINSRVHQVLLQSAASEHVSRMIAMEMATRNASEMISNLTLTMNKLRQASITNELLEIITATEALNK
jgi:F-type H+-transporting ATPase subunit gamma